MKKLKNSILLLLTLSLIITATANLSPAYANPTALKVDPYATYGSVHAPGTWFTVDIDVVDVARLFGFQFKVFYVPTIVQATNIKLGPFFEEPIGDMPDGPVIVWHNETDNELGCAGLGITFGTLSQYFTNGKTKIGSGILATINFTVTGEGGTVLDLSDTEIVNPEGDPMLHEVYFGVFNNLKEAPVAIFKAEPEMPEINEEVKFSASASYDPDGTIVSYYWDFGDGTTETSLDRWGRPTPHTGHSYEFVGTYKVKLTVTDNDGAQGMATVTIKVTPPRALQAKIVDAWPEIRNMKLYQIDLWNLPTWDPFYADVQNLCSASLTVKVIFTVYRDGTKVTTLETSTYTFAEGTYLAEHRFDTIADEEFETNRVIGKYMVQAQCKYQVDNKWVDGNIRTFGFRVTP